MEKDSTRRALVFMAAAAVRGGLGMPSARRVGRRHVTGLGNEPREHQEGGDDGWRYFNTYPEKTGCSRESEEKTGGGGAPGRLRV